MYVIQLVRYKTQVTALKIGENGFSVTLIYYLTLEISDELNILHFFKVIKPVHYRWSLLKVEVYA